MIIRNRPYLLEFITFLGFDLYFILTGRIFTHMAFSVFALFVFTRNIMKHEHAPIEKLMEWLFWFLFVPLSILRVYGNRNKLRWLKNKWLLCSFVIGWKDICDVSNRSLDYRLKHRTV